MRLSAWISLTTKLSLPCPLLPRSSFSLSFSLCLSRLCNARRRPLPLLSCPHAPPSVRFLSPPRVVPRPHHGPGHGRVPLAGDAPRADGRPVVHLRPQDDHRSGAAVSESRRHRRATARRCVFGGVARGLGSLVLGGNVPRVRGGPRLEPDAAAGLGRVHDAGGVAGRPLPHQPADARRGGARGQRRLLARPRLQEGAPARSSRFTRSRIL